MKFVLPFLLLTSTALASPLKIAIIDTGLDLSDSRFRNHICREGHKNFVDDDLRDDHGHGTHVAGLIQQYAEDGKYCFLIYKFYSENISGEKALQNEISSIKEAVENGAEIINISGGGSTFSEEEMSLIKKHTETTFVVAAGNEGQNLDLADNKYYPASYWFSNEIVVENTNKDGTVFIGSNYSKRAVKEIGENVLSTLPDGKMGRMSGSSMSTAIRTGKLVKEMLSKRDKKD